VISRLIEILQNILENSMSAVRVGGELSDWFKIKVGTRLVDPISPTTLVSYLERVFL